MDLSSPITGFSQPSLTSPTYTLVADTAPSLNGKQWAVSALGGTQTGVDANNVSAPFTISFFRPSVIKTADAGVLSAAGIIANIPMNKYSLISRKAVAVNDSGGMGIARVETIFHIPVNASIEDQASIEALISSHVGAIQQDGDQWIETIVQGTL